MSDASNLLGADESGDLLRQALDGDPMAFDALFGLHRAVLHRAVARRLGPSLRGRFDPSDVVQEAQAEAFERLDEFAGRRPMPFRSLLLRTALQRVGKLRRHATAARRDLAFAAGPRYLDHVQVVFASIGPKEVDTYTLDFYKNDGPVDPNSGLNQPGTLIAEFKTQASNIPLPGNGAYGVDWSFTPTLVPDSLTAVVSSSYSTTPGQFMGPFVAVTPPLTGGALNTIWYGDGTPGHWTANDTWAINDVGATNYFDMRFYAVQSVPEPSTLRLLALGACGGMMMVRRRRLGHVMSRG